VQGTFETVIDNDASNEEILFRIAHRKQTFLESALREVSGVIQSSYPKLVKHNHGSCHF